MSGPYRRNVVSDNQSDTERDSNASASESENNASHSDISSDNEYPLSIPAEIAGATNIRRAYSHGQDKILRNLISASIPANVEQPPVETPVTVETSSASQPANIFAMSLRDHTASPVEVHSTSRQRSATGNTSSTRVVKKKPNTQKRKLVKQNGCSSFEFDPYAFFKRPRPNA